MKEREYKDYLQDILDSINDIKTFVEEINIEQFKNDKKTINAVVRSIEIIGEAANHISVSFQRSHKQIPWKQVIGMRNRLIHAYFDVDYDSVWDTVQEDIPKLIEELEKLILI